MSRHYISSMFREDGRTLEATAWPGGYPIIYQSNGGETLCPDCATRLVAEHRNDSFMDACGFNDPDIAEDWQLDFYQDAPMGPGWRELPDAYGIHWEGQPIECDSCGATIDSAYGDPDSPDED